MSDTLRDQLLGLGFKPVPKPERVPQPKSGHNKPAHKSAHGKPAHNQAAHNQPGHGKPGGDRRAAAAGRPGAGQQPRHPPGKSGPARPGQGKPRTREDIDLAKAYAIRAQREKDERLALEQAKQEEARLRREARAKLAELVKDKGLNVADAEISRHFPYGGKIKRIYVTQEQLKALNAGELGVLQMEGRYVLVTIELLVQAEAIFPPAVALKIDPNAPVEDDPYADPQYQVPDDLVW